ncbi:MAG: hypothetical protein EBR30_05020 [Cytophagia bacterium]|nr:hypothetical protein [Cytophagia bacterium]
MLEKYSNVLDWQAVGKNKRISWASEAMERFEDRLFNDKRDYVYQMSVVWLVELVQRLIEQQRITWNDLMWQDGVFKNAKVLALCLAQWSKEENPPMHDMSDKLDLRNYRMIQYRRWGADSDAWGEHVVEQTKALRWDLFSGVTGFPWTIRFIEKHQDKWD